MPIKNIPYWRLPYIWCWVLLLLVGLTFAIVSIIIVARAMRTGYNCLLINGDPETDLLDVQLGTHIPILLLPQETFRSDGIYWPSPDGKYVARFEPSVNVATTSVHMVIQSYKPPVPAAQRRYLINGQTIDTSINEASWSPDNQWIAYHWLTPDGQNYLAVQDASGKYQQTRRLQSRTGEAIQFNDWSSDSRYIAVLNRDDGTRSARISFWSVPDLQPVDPGIYGQSVNSGCDFSSTEYDIYCTHWSPQGHQVAYSITDDAKQSRLVIMNPGDGNIRVFDLSSPALQTIQWSPDGRYVAVASLNQTADAQLLTDAQLDVFGIDGTTRRNIADVQEAGVGCADCTWEAEYVWSADGTAIIGVHPGEYNPDAVDVMVYHLDTGQRTFLTTVENTVINFAMSPTRQSAILLVDGAKAQMLSLDGQVSRQLDLDIASPYYLPGDVQWSPDGETFAFNEGSADGNHDIVSIFDSNGNLLRKFMTWAGILEDANGLVWTRCN